MPHICILSTSNEFRTDQQEAAVQLAVLSRYPRNQKQTVRFRSLQCRSHKTQTKNLKIESLDTCGWISTPSFTVRVTTLGRAPTATFLNLVWFFPFVRGQKCASEIVISWEWASAGLPSEPPWFGQLNWGPVASSATMQLCYEKVLPKLIANDMLGERFSQIL